MSVLSFLRSRFLLSYIFILVMLYIVLYACVCALIVMCNFRGITVLALGQSEFSFPPRFLFSAFSALSTFSALSDFYALSAFSAFSAHKNFLHLNTA